MCPNESVAEVNKGERETSPAKREPSTDREAGTKQNPRLQKTVEVVPFIKNWSLEEAQQAIEQVRQRPVPIPPTMKQPVVNQPEAERPAEKRTKHRPEPTPAAVKAPPVAVEAELKQTLITERKPKPATARETAPESAREKCKLTIAQVGTRRIAVLADEADADTA